MYGPGTCVPTAQTSPRRDARRKIRLALWREWTQLQLELTPSISETVGLSMSAQIRGPRAPLTPRRVHSEACARLTD